MPGPGAYNSNNLSLSGISFTKDLRNRIKDKGVPGPGAYRIPVTFANVPNYLIPNRDENARFIWA